MLKNVSLTLRTETAKVDILKNINFQIATGETVGIVGPSGSGKTSLLMVLAGLEPVSKGHITVEEITLDRLKEDERSLFRRDHIGFVFQDFHLIPTMTAIENVAVPLEIASQDSPFSKAELALKAANMGHRTNHYPGELSGGEQQRVALARAIALKPKILLADEPTGNLDAKTGSQIMDIVFDLNKKYGTTIVLVTHDNQLAIRCRRQILLQDGQIKRNKVNAVIHP
ncbi:MAG: putative ABC transporter ATP-binding protein [Alphaproteobacteria bacterium MarineAlpha3_Bin5]|nr:ABC transporter [Magnetovibrio sp.]PPR77200.1 MAG: putative ABC transporter ATP-binding protein [Alphaproteobacteria bacterium MarineAlpha3_Bin5]